MFSINAAGGLDGDRHPKPTRLFRFTTCSILQHFVFFGRYNWVPQAPAGDAFDGRRNLFQIFVATLGPAFRHRPVLPTRLWCFIVRCDGGCPDRDTKTAGNRTAGRIVEREAVAIIKGRVRSRKPFQCPPCFVWSRCPADAGSFAGSPASSPPTVARCWRRIVRPRRTH